METQN
jgi:hypothetical protein